ncbi:MAG TPA: mechanosensitive ion channel domain-containing protein [Burkholderiaceae bacterium]|jgi:small-conductance mechanosensitive channel
MKPTFLSGLLLDFWSDVNDLSNPGLLWQVLTLIVCIAAGSALARLLRAKYLKDHIKLNPQENPGIVKLGVDSFSRVLSPLLGLLLIELARPLLAIWHHVNVLRLFTPLLASFVILRAAFYVMRRIFARNGQAGAFLLVVEKVVSVIVWLGVALYVTGWWPDLLQFLDDTTVPIGAHKISLLVILQGGASVALTLIAAMWLGAAVEDRLMRIDTMHSSLRAVMARMVRALLVLVAILVSLSLVGIDLTVLSVFSGALGVGLGLGLQKIASSYVSGFVILIERSLAIGDLVAVDKYYGVVTHINTRYTVLQGLDGVESVVPNDVLISNAIQNYSLTNSALRLATTFTVGYKTDLEKILPLLEAAALEIPRVSKLPAPQAVLVKFGALGFDLELGFWIPDPQNGRSGVTSDVNRAVWRVLRDNDVEILISSAIQNYSPSSSGKQLTTKVTVSYDADMEKVLPIMEEAASQVSGVSKSPAPQAVLARFDPNGFELELAFWVPDMQNGGSGVASNVNRAVWRALKDHNVELPSSKRDIRSMNADEATKNAEKAIEMRPKTPVKPE